MKITFLGAAKTVTGSCYFIETANSKFMVDCGMFQGSSVDESMNEEDFPFNPAELDFILLTHAHIDHSGRIPKIYLDGFNGEVIATKATFELCSIMLPDSGHIQEFENEWINRKRLRAGKPLVAPLYTHQDAIDSLELFKSVSYGEIIKLSNNIKVRFNDAGHLLGSSIIEIWLEENQETTKLVFSGDLGNQDMPILRDPSIIESADYLVIESTYGNRVHTSRKQNANEITDIILETVEKGGNVIIPSFAVGRTQEIIYELNKQLGRNDKRLKAIMDIPVFVDSPLAISATEVFRNNLDCYDEEARSYVENGDNPLDFSSLKFTRTSNESKALNKMDESVIIISASGMCNAGRIKHHLKHNLWRPDSTILFVGYQAEGTLGRRIVDGANKVKIFGEEISVNARIETIDSLSGHADREGLLNWIKSFRKKPSKIFVVHGEKNQIIEFADTIKNEFGIDTVAPSIGESFKISMGKVSEKTLESEKLQTAYTFKRDELLKTLEQLKDELDELTDVISEDLNKRKDNDEKDIVELEELSEKMDNLEKNITKFFGIVKT